MQAVTVQALRTEAVGVMYSIIVPNFSRRNLDIRRYLREFIIHYCCVYVVLEMFHALKRHTRILFIVSGCPEE